MSNLSLCTKVLKKYEETLNLPENELKFQLIDLGFDKLFPNLAPDMLFSVSDSEIEYMDFLRNLYKDISRKFNAIAEDDETSATTLNDVFSELTIRIVTQGICSDFEDRTITPEIYLQNFDKIPYLDIKDEGAFVKAVTTQSSDEGFTFILENLLKVLDNVKSEVKRKSEDELYIEHIANNIVGDIMNMYESLYEPCFIVKPMGVLTKEGFLVLNKNFQPTLDRFNINYATDIYNTINDVASGCLNHPDNILSEIDSNFINLDGSLNYNYCPVMHLLNVNGLYKDSEGVIRQEKNWSKYKGILKSITRSRIINALKTIDINNSEVVKRLSRSFKNLMTNGMLVVEFDKKTILNLYGTLDGDASKLATLLRNEGRQRLDAKTGSLITCSKNNNDIYSIIYAYDNNKYSKEILFSYKYYDKLISSNVKPSSTNLVIGKKVDGSTYTMNFASPQNLVTGIVAGSGSGKGVVTLNILAGLLADDMPVCYVDFKPDMAAMLWDLDRSLNAPIYAVDSLAGVHKFGSKPRRDVGFGLNAPDIPQIKDYFRLIPYLKSVQLFVLLSMLRSSGLACSSKNRAMFIFDELQGMNSDFGALLTTIDSCREKKSDTPFSPEQNAYIDKFLKVFKTDLNAGITKFVKTTGRQGRCGCICLGQAVNPDEWVCGPLTWKNSPLSRIMKASSFRLVGANHSEGNSTYSISQDKLKYPGDNFIKSNKMGYWGIHSGFSTPTSGSAITCVKSYLTLNYNDIEKAINSDGYSIKEPNTDSFTGGLLINVDEDIRTDMVIEEMYNEDGTVNEKVGFAGLVKALIGGKNGGVATDEDLKATLSSGYNLAMEALHYCGIKCDCVEDYLYDCSIDSIFTLGELIERSSSGDKLSKAGLNITSEDVELDENGEPLTYDSNNSSSSENSKKDNGVTQKPLDISATYVPEPENKPHSETISETSKTDSNSSTNSNTDSDNGFGGYGDDELDVIQRGITEEHESAILEEELRMKKEQENRDKLDKIKNRSQTNSDFGNSYSSGGAMASEPRHSMNTMSEPNEYKREFKVSQDMVNMYSRSGNNINKVYAINQLSAELIRLIDTDFGIDRVHSFEVVGDGYIRINDTLYKPFLPNVVIDMLPVDIQQFVKEGKVIELFNFKDLYRFKGLEILSIENPRLAEGRVRRELGMTPKHDWMFVFKKFRNLQKIIIAGQDISDVSTSNSYQNSYKQGFNLGESLVNKFFGGNKPKKSRDYSAMNPLIHTGNGLASTMMKSRTCRVATKALGYTAGLKAVTVIASMLGPWGVLFGAMAVYGTVTQARKNGGLFADDGSQYANNNSSGGMGYTNPLYEDDEKPKRKPKSKSKGSGKGRSSGDN